MSNATEDGAARAGFHATQRRFELMADALPVLIAYVDREGRYRYNNAAYERWFGEEIQGRKVEDVVGERAFADIRPHLAAALAGETVRYEATVGNRDGSLRRVVARYVPDRTATGEVVGLYALVEDVTEVHEAEAKLRAREEELRQAQKMEALGRLAGGIAHEFGNLLMTVINSCTAISEAVVAGRSPAALIARLERAARRGRSLTQQLLAFCSESELQMGPVDIDALTGDFVQLLDQVLGSRVELELDLRAGASIIADAGQLQQVLMNLALNARDAMPEGGRLRITTALEQFDAGQAFRDSPPGAYVVLAVSDTGTGMHAATRERIFEPFFTTKPKGEGTGLGLPTVFGIVRQAGGAIDVETAPGRGSTFRICLPAVLPAA